jgi:hypothetical protein
MAFAFKEETAPNIEQLKKMAATKTDANQRLLAIEELGKWKSKQSIDILWHLMINDLVYEVQHAAFLHLQSFGEKVRLPKKAKGNLVKQINKKIEKIVKSLQEEVNLSEFIMIFQKEQPEDFDIYKHEKKDKFDMWLKNILSSLPAEIRAKVKLN